MSILLTMCGLLLDSTVRRSMRLRDAHRDMAAQAASVRLERAAVAIAAAFTATLRSTVPPPHDGSASPATAAASAGRSDGTLRILLVDDARDNVVLVKAILRSSGAQLDVAENGAMAVARFLATATI